MTVQLIIQGDHVTDLLAHIQQLSMALGTQQEVVHTVQLGTAAEPPFDTDADAEVEKNIQRARQLAEKGKEQIIAESADNEDEAKPEPVEATPKKLTRSESMKAIKEMMESGVKDERYDLLSRASQKKIDEAIADVQELVDEIEQNETETTAITGDACRELMGKLGMDENGNPVQERLLKIREVLVKYVPEGVEVPNVSAIPEADLEAFYNELKAFEV